MKEKKERKPIFTKHNLRKVGKKAAHVGKILFVIIVIGTILLPMISAVLTVFGQ